MSLTAHPLRQPPRRRAWTRLAAVASAAALSAPAAAQLEEVVVTAERREASMQTVPVAVTAIGAEQIEEKLITNVHDLQYQTPNISIARNTGTASGARIFMRGIGEDESRVSADPAISVYVDGVYLGRQTGALLDLLDVERIEVLRGPQGTLYGRNSSAGAVKLISVKPGEENEATVGGTIGSEGRVDLRASGNWAISDAVSMRGAFLSRSRDGLHTTVASAVTPEREEGDIDVQAARLAWRFLAGDAWTVDLAIDQTSDDSDPVPASHGGSLNADGDLFTIEPLSGSMQIETDENGTALVPESTLNTGDCRDRTRYYFDAEATTPTVKPLNPNLSGGGARLGCREFSSTVDTGGLSLSASGALSDDFTLSLLAGYRQLEDELDSHIGGSYQQQTDQDQLSFETSIASAGDADAPGAFVAGLYYFTEDVRLDSSFFGAGHSIDVRAKAIALFGHGSYEFTDALTLTAGLRYTDETKDFAGDGPAGAPAESRNFHNASYKLAVDWRLNDEVMAYAALVTGFKSGGWSPDCFEGTACFLSVDEEEVQTLEIGLRSELLDRRLRLNATAFQNAYDNQQIAGTVPRLGFTRFNVSESETSGLEIELVYQPTERLRLNATVGLLDTEYSALDVSQAFGLTNADADDRTTGSPCALGDDTKAPVRIDGEDDETYDERAAPSLRAFESAVLSCAYGLEMKNAPESQIAVGALYTMALMGGELDIGVDVAVEDDSWNLVANAPESALTDPGTIINARVAYRAERWQATLWAKNLGDEEYSRASTAGGQQQFAADPALFGLDFQYSF